MINVDPKKLRKELIDIYSKYLSEKTRGEAIEKAKKLDGAWPINFILNKDLEEATNGLIFLYVEPKLNKEEIEIILKMLKQKNQTDCRCKK